MCKAQNYLLYAVLIPRYFCCIMRLTDEKYCRELIAVEDDQNETA